MAKPTGKPNGRPKKKAASIPTGLTWEMEHVPHQSDLHHRLFDIASCFEAGPNWLKSVEVPLTELVGKAVVNRIGEAKWQEDGRDFYALIEKWIENTALSEGKGNEAQFMSSVVKNCARGFVRKFYKTLNETDIGEIVGKTFEKIIVSGKYNPSDLTAVKITYLKTATYSAGKDLLRERTPKGELREEKDINVRSNPKNLPMKKPYTLEDMLVDLNMTISAGKSAKGRKAA